MIPAKPLAQALLIWSATVWIPSPAGVSPMITGLSSIQYAGVRPAVYGSYQGFIQS